MYILEFFSIFLRSFFDIDYIIAKDCLNNKVIIWIKFYLDIDNKPYHYYGGREDNLIMP